MALKDNWRIRAMNISTKKSTLGILGRLVVGFGVMTLVIVVSMGVILLAVSNAKSNAKEVINTTLPIYDTLLDLNTLVYESESAVNNLILTKDSKFKTNFNSVWDDIASTQSTIDGYLKASDDQKSINAWNNIKSLLNQVRDKQNELVLAVSQSSTVPTSLIIEHINLTSSLNNELNHINSKGNSAGLLDIQSSKLNTGSEEIVAHMDFISITSYIVTIFSVLFALLIGYLTTAAINKHIGAYRKHSSRIASGDLTQQIEVLTNDEMGQLGQDLNVMTSSLANITKQITEASHNMVSMLEEVRHAVDVQSSGASEQASSVTQVTASLEEIEKSSTQTMDKAKALGEIAQRTQEKGRLGVDAVEQSVLGMKEVRDKVQMIAQTILDLSNQTQQVGEITSVVNNLAQQSKMLALNASIEAAKAGEAGKGFAVVASEVKNLAEQSEQSTAQVQKILEDIKHATEKAVMVTEEGTKGVDQGTSLVEQTGELIRSLNDVIHETSIATKQIEAAISQEGIGIEQITAGMTEINQVTASFVSSAKQTSEAIANLANITKNLKAYVDTYKV